MSITVPTAVKNAIQDVFEESDNINSVECYHLEDADQFETDVTIHNDVKLYMANPSTKLGNTGHKGSIGGVYTYYGSVVHALHENIKLIDDENNVLENISEYNNYERSMLSNRSDWAVLVIETTEWESETNEFHRKETLYIYCPVSGNYDEDEQKYDEVYQSLKNERGDV